MASKGRGECRSGVNVIRSLTRIFQEWINDVAVAEAGPSTTTAATVAPVTALPEKLAALRKKSVKVPSDTNVVCPICKEPFVKELDQENEEWVWRNALAIETKVSERLFSTAL